MEQIKKEYRRLKDQLVNAGEETCHDEVMWNDGILIAMEELLKEVNDDVKNKIILNLI